MTMANCEIKRGDTLTRFLISDTIRKRFAVFEAHETMPDKLQYKFQNGFVDVGDLPCRKVFWQQMANRTVDLASQADCKHIYFANGKRKVDFSSFIYVPTHVQHWASSILTADQAQTCRFRLSTCGGVRIWVNGELVVQFTPFKRNESHSTEISLPLEQGDNSIVVHAEDLFERDTQYFFELTLLDDTCLKTRLEGVDSTILAELEHFVSGFAYDLNLSAHKLALDTQDTLAEKLVIDGHVSGMSNEEETDLNLESQAFSVNGNPLVIELPCNLKPAHYAVALNFVYKGISITRVCHVNILADSKADSKATLAERKQACLEFTANEGMNIPGKLLALLATGSQPELAASILNRSLQKISLREDCSDFWMVSVLWAWKMSGYTQLSDKLWDRTKSSILGYRYWLDEPGNDAMWFWSENHVLCFHVSQLLAGQFFPRDTFLCSGRQGREQQAIATKRLNLWFDHILENGLTEWNSSCYYPIDYIGLFAIYELAECEALKARAKTVIDRLMTMSALHFQSGIASGTMGRVYEKELMANEMTELAGFGQVAWGNGWHTRMCASLPMFCLSSYQPPEISNKVARLAKGETVEAFYTQGMDKCAKVIAWKQPGVTLSSVVDHMTGQHGHQQHVLDIQFAQNPKARLWVNHPGEDVPGGEGRPSYWAGNGNLPRVMQHRQKAMMVFNLPDDARLDFTHLYLPREALDEIVIKQNGCFVRSANAYAIFGCSSPLELVEKGQTQGREVRAYAKQVAWFISVGELDSATDFEQLVADWENMQINLTGENDELAADMSAPDGEQFALSWQGHCQINGQSLSFPAEAGLNPIIKE